MSKAAFLAILGVVTTVHGTAFAQSLKQVDCGAFQKQSDGSYLTVQDTSIIDVSDNTVDISKGQVIGPGSIMINGWSGRDLIDQKCGATALQQANANQTAATATASTPPPLPAIPVPPPLPAMPVPPPLPPEPQFYYNEGGKPIGPVNLAELQAKIAAGAIRPTTLVWKSGTPNWVAAKDLTDLSASFGPTMITPTPNQSQSTSEAHAGTTDLRNFLFGTWETDGPGPAGTDGPAKMVLTLGQDGNVQGTYTVHLVGSGATASIPVTGTWSAVPLSDKQATIRFNLLVHDNKGQSQALNKTATVEMVDQDTLRDTADGTITKRVKG